ncbi:C-type lectin domain family 2 member D-like [Sorex araneus]|uniref:C-type lectin domain family 2 member D-like n=1 Tax=Sorex araneus TaxID=42254 RepID=UPI0024336933|nr:C-type lectin domain family 2 member D-like [Sorex araneus]
MLERRQRRMVVLAAQPNLRETPIFDPLIQVPSLQDAAAVDKEETMVVEDSPKEMQKCCYLPEHHRCLLFSGKEQFGAQNQEKCRTTQPSETLHRHAFCFITMILIIVIIVVPLSVTLTVRKERTVSEVPVQLACPLPWIGFGNKCFYFSEETENWTFSRTVCDSLGAHLVQIDTSEELIFLRRYKGPGDHWIGLHREPPSQSWKWINTTSDNMVFQVSGTGECAYLNDNGVSSARIYSDKKWICSKPNVSTCPIASNS